MTLRKAISWFNACANVHCRVRPVRTRLLCSGAYLEQQRYCSPDCLRAGLEERLADLAQSSKGAYIRRQHRIPIGLQLISRSCIDPATLKMALLRQKSEPQKRLGEILIDMGAVVEEQISAAVAAQWSVPMFRLDPTRVPEAASLIPVALMQRYKMLPVHFVKQTNKLHLAFAQVVDRSILYAIEQMLGVTTEPCISDESTLLRLIQCAGHQERPAEYVLNSLSRTELVCMIAGYALRLRADRISAAACNDQIWVRAVSRGTIVTHFLTSLLPLRPALLAADAY